jgi:putative ABC transport system permease protein
VLGLTSFNQLIQKNLEPDFTHNPVLLLGALAIALGIGIISGIYPAFYLPSIPTIQALKGSYKNRKSSHTLRRVLITAQFAISIFVVVCTLFMKDQIEFMRNKELGFNKDNTVILPIQDTLVERQINGIKTEFLRQGNITAATTSYNVPGMNVGGNSVLMAESESGMKQQAFTMMFVGEDFIKTMGMTILTGRDFQSGPNADTEDVYIVNEAAAKLMGWGDNPVGKKVKGFHAEKDGQVIGMVKDFNYNSLHNKVEPLVMIKAKEQGGFLYLKVKGENLPQTMSYIKDQWLKYDPNHPYEYFFLDQKFDEQYKEDEVQHSLLSDLSYICIFISLLGLLGLSAFTAAQRTKEIGVRKVHGASIPQIIFLLYKDVMFLIIIAAVLIVPVAYYVVSQWMGNFAYQTKMNYMLFGIVAVVALLFAFLTVAFHSLKTARTNPVESLKYE